MAEVSDILNIAHLRLLFLTFVRTLHTNQAHLTTYK